MVSPSPLFVLTPKSAPFCALQSYVDNAARLEFQKPETPELIFKKALGFLDFTTILFFGGSVLCLLFGYFGLKDKNYLDYLKFSTNERKAYLSLFLSRAIFITLFFIVLLFEIAAILLLNGIKVGLSLITCVIWLFIPALLTMLFSVAIGMFAGAVRKRGLVMAFLIWLIFAVAIPEWLNEKIDNDASKLNRYMLELSKISILMNFENEVYQQKIESNADTPGEKFEIDKRMTERYKDKDSQEISAIEKENLEAIKSLIAKLHWVSNISPFTLFKSTANEVGSMGYNTYRLFYKGNREMQRGFFLFYKEKVYDNPYDKVIPYLNKGENLYMAIPTLPQYYFLGILACIAYISAFLFFGFLGFKKSHKEKKTVLAWLQELSINMIKGQKYHYFLTKDERIAAYCVHLAANGKIQVDGEEIPKSEVYYLPAPDSLPGKPEAWKKFFAWETGKELWELFIETAIRSGKKLIVGHCFTEMRTDGEIDKIREKLIDNDALFLEIGRERDRWKEADDHICWKGDKSIDFNKLTKFFKG